MSTNPYERYVVWELMNPIERALWGTVLALHINEPDGGLKTADAAVEKLRSTGEIRSHRPEPEYEAARAGFDIEFEAFAAWYPVECLIRHGAEPNYRSPTFKEIEEAYDRFQMGR
jgi:hypothetical protein